MYVFSLLLGRSPSSPNNKSPSQLDRSCICAFLRMLQVRFIAELSLFFFLHSFNFCRLKDSSGWQHVFTSSHIENCIERIAINAKMGSGGAGETSKMVALSYGSQVRLWGISDDGTQTSIGKHI